MSPLVYRRLSDEQLGGRLARGEASAFDELYRRYAHRLAAYGAHLLGDGAAGDDVAQSTLLKAYGALREGRIPEQVRPWLYRIAHNVAVDLVRRRREVPAESVPDGPAATSAEDAGALLSALAALPERQRRVYVLRELHGLRIDEAAAEIGLTVPQVEQALFAARNRLAEHLVFGDRLNCASVRRLAAGPLDLSERRALKTHVRSCPACRRELGLRGRALGALPIGPSNWLQWLGGLFAGGGAPVAAKVGVIAAVATVAAGVPLAADRPQHFAAVAAPSRPAVAHRQEPRRAVAAVVPRPVTQRVTAAAPVSHTAPLVLALSVPKRPVHETRTAQPDPTEVRAAPEPHTGSDGTRRGGDGGGDGGDVRPAATPVSATQPASPAPAPAPAPAATTTTETPTTTTETTTAETSTTPAPAPTDTSSANDGSSSSSSSGSSDGGSSSSSSTDGGGDN